MAMIQTVTLVELKNVSMRIFKKGDGYNATLAGQWVRLER